ncbi:MAG: hypothetical protein ANABAC_2547 [Anaerolineae bacterium]|nr:MAG: hypothetical protein ANABAC_2547 [Anaerolineae bacterium]
MQAKQLAGSPKEKRWNILSRSGEIQEINHGGGSQRRG